MTRESTLEELEAAYAAATRCVEQVGLIKGLMTLLSQDVTPAIVAETFEQPTCKLLERWHLLKTALNPHVSLDFIAVCGSPVEIGSVIGVSAHAAVLWVSRQALLNLATVLIPAGLWPSSEDSATDIPFPFLRSQTTGDVSDGTLAMLRSTFDEFSLQDLSRCIMLAQREWAAARKLLPSHSSSVTVPTAELNSDLVIGFGGGLDSPPSKSADWTAADKDFAVTRERLRPYVENPAFREYLTSQIVEWETWYRSQAEEIRRHEIWRDEEKERLDRDISQGTVDPEDHDHIGVTDYEYHKEKVLTISQDLEFRLVADGEPICFREASRAAMVALFWSDINSSNLLVPVYEMLPDFDPFEPNGPFWKQLSLQWDETTQGRYKHIHWFVEAAIKAYEAKIADESEVPPSGSEAGLDGDDTKPPVPPQKQTAKERESAFDDVIMECSDPVWKRDKCLVNKAWRVRKGQQTGELFGDAATERGWYQSRAVKRPIKKDDNGVWVYLTTSHSEKLRKFFSEFNEDTIREPSCQEKSLPSDST